MALNGKEASIPRRFAGIYNMLKKLAVKYSDCFIAIHQPFKLPAGEYRISSGYIPYGAEIYTNESTRCAECYNLIPGNYYLLVARMEPENNIETILDGFVASKSDKKFIVVGNVNNSLWQKMIKRFSKVPLSCSPVHCSISKSCTA